MKNILNITIVLLALISCKAQIIPVEQVLNSFDLVEEGVTTHIKDVNNVFDDYVGTWKGVQNDKEYTFVITEKTIVFDEEYNINADILLIRHKIIDLLNNEVVEDELLVSYDDIQIEGIYFTTNSANGLTYILSYGGDECGQNGDVAITLFNDNTQMYFITHNQVETSYSSDCPDGLVNHNLPTELMVLTKQ